MQGGPGWRRRPSWWRGSASSCGPRAGIQLLLDGREKSIFLRHNEIDDSDVHGKTLEVDIAQIVRVLFCRDQRNCMGVLGCFEQFSSFGIGIAMMIGKSLLSGDGEPPVFEVNDEGPGIADPAEGVERAGTEFRSGEHLRRCCGEFSKPEQASLRGENSAVL